MSFFFNLETKESPCTRCSFDVITFAIEFLYFFLSPNLEYKESSRTP